MKEILTISGAAVLFISDCKIRSLSKKTIKTYTNVLRKFYDKNDVDITSINTRDLRQFILESQSQYAKSTVHKYVRVLKTFFSWCFEEGLIEFDPSSRISYPKLPSKEINILTDDEIETLLKNARANKFRDYVILLTLLDSGMRRQELSSLKIQDLDLDNNRIKIKGGKGNKDRTVIIGRVTRESIERYLRIRNSESEYVFVTTRSDRMSNAAINAMFSRLSERTDIHVTPHVCRHTFATNLARKIPNAIVLAELLGHNDLAISKRYCHFAGSLDLEVESHMDEMYL